MVLVCLWLALLLQVYKSSTIANPVSDVTTDLIEDDFEEDAYFV
jgi:hypothetical protein